MLAIKGLSTACHTRNDYRGRSIVDEVCDMNHFNTQMSMLPRVQKKKEYRDEMSILSS
jgi:cytochrome c5